MSRAQNRYGDATRAKRRIEIVAFIPYAIASAALGLSIAALFLALAWPFLFLAARP